MDTSDSSHVCYDKGFHEPLASIGFLLGKLLLIPTPPYSFCVLMIAIEQFLKFAALHDEILQTILNLRNSHIGTLRRKAAYP